MAIDKQSKMLTTTSVAAAASPYNTAATNVDHPGYSIQANIVETVAITGNIRLQASCDNKQNWVDIPGSQRIFAGSGSIIWNFSETYYPAIRAVITIDVGTATFDIFFTTKSWE